MVTSRSYLLITLCSLLPLEIANLSYAPSPLSQQRFILQRTSVLLIAYFNYKRCGHGGIEPMISAVSGVRLGEILASCHSSFYPAIVSAPSPSSEGHRYFFLIARVFTGYLLASYSQDELPRRCHTSNLPS